MITETEFYTRVRHLVATGPEKVRESNDTILALASELTVARNARNRRRLADVIDAGQRHITPADERYQVKVAHQAGESCGRIFCLRCGPGDVA